MTVHTRPERPALWVQVLSRRADVGGQARGDAPRDNEAALFAARVADRMAKTILVVDDSRMARTLVKAVLADLRPSWVVETAADGSEALAKAHALDRLDGVLLDINMPGKDGMQVANELRVSFSELPIFFISANVQERVRSRAKEQGCGFVGKPINKDKLQDFIRLIG